MYRSTHYLWLGEWQTHQNKFETKEFRAADLLLRLELLRKYPRISCASNLIKFGGFFSKFQLSGWAMKLWQFAVKKRSHLSNLLRKKLKLIDILSAAFLAGKVMQRWPQSFQTEDESPPLFVESKSRRVTTEIIQNVIDSLFIPIYAKLGRWQTNRLAVVPRFCSEKSRTGSPFLLETSRSLCHQVQSS